MDDSRLKKMYGIVAMLAVLAIATLLLTRGVSAQSAELGLFMGLLAWASVEDMRSRTIPNASIGAAVALRAVYLVFCGLTGTLSLREIGYYVACGLGTLAALIAFALVFERVTGHESMGGGDVKLYAVAGLYFGAHQVLIVLFLSCILAFVIALSAKADRAEDGLLARRIPFGPAISASIAIVILVFS